MILWIRGSWEDIGNFLPCLTLVVYALFFQFGLAEIELSESNFFELWLCEMLGCMRSFLFFALHLAFAQAERNEVVFLRG